MRITAVIALFLLALCAPAHALAGTFVVPFGGGTSMLAAGWAPRADAPAVCGFEGGTVFLNAGTLGAHDGCLYLFNAPAAAQITSVTTTLSYVKASAATALCAYSFAAQPGDTLRRCSAGTFTNSVSTSLANWVELGLYNEGGAPIAVATSRANNVTFASGWVTISDPTPPALSASGPTGVQSGFSAELQWAASDPESGAPAVTYAIDGGARVTLRGQACSWLCGTGDTGTAAIDLGALADGAHSLTVYAQSYADAASSVGPLPFSVDRSPPAQAVIKVEHDPASTLTGWWGHAPIALTISSSTEADVVASALWVYGPTGALVFQHDLAGALRSSAVPASALGANGAYRVELLECDGPGHCSASTSAAFHWDGAPPPASIDAFAAPLGLVAARDGAHLRWPALTGAAGLSGIAGAYLGTGASAASARAQALAAPQLGGRRPWRERGGDPGRPRARGRPGVSRGAPALGRGHRRCLRKRALRGGRRAAAGDRGARRERMERRTADARARSRRRERRLVLGDPAGRRPDRGARRCRHRERRGRACAARRRARCGRQRDRRHVLAGRGLGCAIDRERERRLHCARGAGRRRRCALGRRRCRGAPGRRRAGDAAGDRRPHGCRARPGRPRAGRRERVACGRWTRRRPPMPASLA